METIESTKDGITTVVKGGITILDNKGDTKISWDRHNPEEVRLAREHFDKLRGKQYLGFRMEAGGRRGEQLDRFEPDAEEIVMIPRSVGG